LTYVGTFRSFPLQVSGAEFVIVGGVFFSTVASIEERHSA